LFHDSSQNLVKQKFLDVIKKNVFFDVPQVCRRPKRLRTTAISNDLIITFDSQSPDTANADGPLTAVISAASSGGRLAEPESISPTFYELIL
jgi:hypothetical protein